MSNHSNQLKSSLFKTRSPNGKFAYCADPNWTMLHLTGFRKVGMSHNCVTGVECQKIHKKSRKFPVIFELALNWTDGQRTIIERPYIAVFDFMNILKRNYPGTSIPELKDAKWFESLWKARKEDKKKALDEFFQKILSLPESVANGKEVFDFFAFPWRRDSEVMVPGKSEEIGGTRAQSTAIFSHVECTGEYESIDFEKTEYSILSIKPKSIAVFPNMTPSDTNGAYWAVTEYSKRKSGEVDLMVGAAVSVIQRELSGWWFVYVEDSNEQGWAPAACLLPDDRTNLQDCKITAPCGEFQALKDFEATEADEVSCKKGEKVEVIQASLDGWWKVRCGDKVGIIPATNLEPLSSQTKSRTSLYHQSGIYKKDSPPPRRNSKIPVEELYSKVDKFRRDAPQITTSSTESTYDNRKDDVIEMPVAPRKQQEESQKMDNCTDDNDDDDDGQHLYINDSRKSAKHSYVNVELQPRRSTTDGVKYYRSVTRHEPKAKHLDRPMLVADVGDIIESHFEETDEVYGKLYRLADGSIPDSKEGWISKLRLESHELGSDDLAKAGLHSHTRLLSEGIVKRPVPAKRVKAVKPAAVPDMKSSSEPRTLPSGEPVDSHANVNKDGETDRTARKTSAHKNVSCAQAKTEASVSSHLSDSCREIAVPEKYRIHRMSRSECEDILLSSAKNCQFMLRESAKTGHFALSVRSVVRVRHFPIEFTAEKKYFIGRYNFDSLEEVIAYYSQNALFELDDGTKVKLGTSLERF